MKKSSLNKKITFAIALLLGVGGAATGLSSKETPAQRVEAGTGPTYSITVSQACNSGGTSYSIFGWWGGASFDDDPGWDSFASHSGEFIYAYHTNLNYATKVTVKIDFVSCDSTNSPQVYLVVDYSKQSAKKTLSKGQNTLTWNLPKDVATGTNISFCFDYPNATSSGENYLYFNGFTNDTPIITIETDDSSRAVSMSALPGVKSVYLSKTSTATSGSASGTKFNDGDVVYGFAELAAGYTHPSSWTKVSGTDDTEGAKYRVGSITVSSSATSISYTAPTAKTKSIARNGNGGSSGSNVTLTYGLSATVPALSRSGYSFINWNTNSSGTGTAYDTALSASQVNSIVLGSVTTFYAQWSPNNYTVSFDKRGGGGGSNNVTATFDSAMPNVTPPTRTGYVFDGYYDNISGGTKYYNADGTSARTWNKASDTTLYARWSYNSEIQAVVDLIEGIGGPSNVKYPDSKSAIDEARAEYNALSDDYKAVIESDYGVTLTQDETKYNQLQQAAIADANAKIDAIGSLEDISYPESHDVLVAAEGAYNLLTDEDKALISDERRQLLEDARAAYNDQRDDAVQGVVSAINSIVRDGEGNILYPNSKTSIENARALFDALAPEEKTNPGPVSNYNALTQAETDYQNLLEEAVSNVINAINAIDKPFSENREQQISNAQSLFDALDDSQKSDLFITNIDKLDAAKAADQVADMIEAIPAASDTDAYREYVESVRTAYDALTNDQQAFMPNTSSLYDCLLENEDAIVIMDAINAIGDVTYTSESNTLINNAQALYDAYIAKEYDPNLIANFSKLTQAHTDYDNVDDLVNEINNLGAVEYSDAFHEKLISARENFINLSAYQKSIFPASILKVLEDDEKAYQAMDLISKLAPMVNTSEHKALIKEARDYLNNLQTNYPDAYALVDADKIAMLEDYEAAQVVIDMINDIADPVYSQEYKDKMDAAEAAYQALSSDVRRELVVNYSTLTKNQEDYAKAKEVIELINNIGTVTYNGGQNDSLDAIELAESKYASLSADQKTLVNSVNYSTLTDDRTVYDNANHAVNLINAIGKVENSDTSKGKIDAARVAYDALTPQEKALVDSYNNSTKTLLDDEAVYEAMKKIDAIGKVGYNTNSEEAINKAKEFYDSLTDDQKAQLGEEYYNILNNARTEYASMKQSADIWVIVLLIVTSLTVVGGAFCLFLLLKKKRKDEDNQNGDSSKVEPVKMMSISGLFPSVALISHYADAPWIAFYVIAGIALLVWVSVLVIFLKKKQFGPFKKQKPVESPVEMSTQTEPTDSFNKEVVNVAGETENVFQIRFIKSFTAKLSQSSDEVKSQYNELKNYILSYKDTNSRVSWHYDSINIDKNQVLKFAIRGKTLCVYYALDKVDEKYKVEKTESKKFAEVPTLYRIKNDRRLAYAKELIDILMKKFAVRKGKELNNDYRLPYEDTEALLTKGLIKEVKTNVDRPLDEHHEAISVEEADERMSDDVAESKIEEDKTSKKHEGKKGIINIDTIGDNFNDGDLVDLEALWAKKLVPTNVGYVKVLARGILNKRLNVDLQDYSIQAVKMILLEGGTVKKAK